MIISAPLQKVLNELREWAVPHDALMYIFDPAGKPRVLVYRDEVLKCNTDEDLWAFLQKRFDESWNPK